MRPVRLSELARWCGGRLHGDDRAIEAIGHDTRALPAGGLYVALVGERFDGHDFCDAAADAGAAALLVSRPVPSPISQIVCEDTLRALGQIAAGLAEGRPARVVGLTGSNGKTTVKTLLLSILEQAAPGQAYANPGNRNNEIGLPLALIDAPEDARYAVYEMGAGKPGDIAYLASIAKPNVALNNIGPAHLERMGTLLGVARTKGAMYAALPEAGVAVINADDAFAPFFEAGIGSRRRLRFGLESSAEITATRVQATEDGWRFGLLAPTGEVDVDLHLPGRHNLRNALAAAATAVALGIAPNTIAEGLAAARGVGGRQHLHRLPHGLTLIDDSYNANPLSVAAAIDLLALHQLPPTRAETWLVLGDMGELGIQAAAFHSECGQRARAARVARLFTVGTLSAQASRAFGADAQHFAEQAALIEALTTALAERVSGPLSVLVKGSRTSAMERVVRALMTSDTIGTGPEVDHAL